MKSYLTGVAALMLAAGAAQAQELNVVCSNEQAWCDLMASDFEAETGIDVAMVRKSTGEVLAQIRAEAANPKIDVWWGGTGDPHLIAAAEELTQPVEVDTEGQQPWAQNMAEISGGRVHGVHAGLLGIAYNPAILEARGIAAPACWEDLADPAFAGEVQVANPNSSGTAYTELATLAQVFGEDEAFDLLARIGRNVNSYTKSGSAPSKAAARGETGVAIGFMHDMVNLKKEGFPLEIVAPCEGTGYEVGGVSVIAGAAHPDEAKTWVEYVLSPAAQTAGLEVGVYNVPSSTAAELDPDAPRLADVKLVDYDFETYGASDTRTRLLQRWEAEVKGAGGAVEE